MFSLLRALLLYVIFFTYPFNESDNSNCEMRFLRHWVINTIIITITTTTWRYSPTWALASCAIRLHWPLSWAYLLYPSIPISHRSSWTSINTIKFLNATPCRLIVQHVPFGANRCLLTSDRRNRCYTEVPSFVPIDQVSHCHISQDCNLEQ
jgi:hypothetical protein